jgi:uncharacterized protein
VLQWRAWRQNRKTIQYLKRFRAALGEMYGPRLTRVVLFGSRARGDAQPDSDYDVAVFLTPLGDCWRELDRLADLRLKFLDETDAFFDAIPYDASAYCGRLPLMRNQARRAGLVKPETARFLEKARNLLAQADTMLNVGLNDAAGRTAYLAGYNAAKALLFEHRNRNYTSHGRVQTNFAQLTKGDERIDPHLRAFLAKRGPGRLPRRWPWMPAFAGTTKTREPNTLTSKEPRSTLSIAAPQSKGKWPGSRLS